MPCTSIFSMETKCALMHVRQILKYRTDSDNHLYLVSSLTQLAAYFGLAYRRSRPKLARSVSSTGSRAYGIGTYVGWYSSWSSIIINHKIFGNFQFEDNRQCKPVSTIFRAALSVGQEKLFLEPFSGVYGTVLIGLFVYVKWLTNLLLFWSGDSAGQFWLHRAAPSVSQIDYMNKFWLSLFNSDFCSTLNAYSDIGIQYVSSFESSKPEEFGTVKTQKSYITTSLYAIKAKQ